VTLVPFENKSGFTNRHRTGFGSLESRFYRYIDDVHDSLATIRVRHAFSHVPTITLGKIIFEGIPEIDLARALAHVIVR